MIRILLVRGMLAGFVAGLFVFALARWIGEPQVNRAIAFESVVDRAKGEPSEAETVTRRIQSGLGLLTATVVDGAALGGIFALVFAYAFGRMPIASPRTLSALLAALAFVSLAVVPALKYPANPPSVGRAETIGMRTSAFFLLVAFSVLSMVFAVTIERWSHARLGGWNATAVAGVIFVGVISVISHLLPDINEVPPGFPVMLMWKFRVAAMEMQILLWSVLGFFFGRLAEKSLQAQRLHN